METRKGKDLDMELDTEVRYADEFRKYWNARGRYLSVNNAARTMANICSWLENCNSIYDIEGYVTSMRAKKESTRRIIVDFLSYLEKETGRDYGTILSEKRFFDDVLERRLEIAKYLHEPHTPAEIRERFDISEETVKKDLKALREGLEVFGTTIELDEQRKGRKKYYKTTMHPIFLPLNLTEVYAMTAYLEQHISPNEPNSMVIKTVIDRIKAQLSDYAWGKLYEGRIRPDQENYYVSDQDLAESREGIRTYLEKSGRQCKFFYNGRPYYGKITRNRKILLDNGEYLDADLRHVEFIIDDLKYK